MSERALPAAADLPDWTLEQVLLAVHQPWSSEVAHAAREALHRIAAFVGLTHAHRHVAQPPDGTSSGLGDAAATATATAASTHSTAWARRTLGFAHYSREAPRGAR